MTDDVKNPRDMDEEESEIIELTDENGETSQFEYLTTIDYDGELYVVLMLLGDDETTADDDEGEVLVLKIAKDEDSGEDIYVSVDDESISEAVFNKFVAMMDEEGDE